MSSLPAKSAVAVDAVLFVVIIVGSLLLLGSSIPCSRRFSFSIHLEAADDDEDDDDDSDDDDDEINDDDLRYKANGALIGNELTKMTPLPAPTTKPNDTRQH